MRDFSIVTGANGHLGNNLVRLLRQKGEPVIAGVRGAGPWPGLTGLDVATAQCDLHDLASLRKAFHGAKTVYLVGAVFKHWSTNMQKDIYEANILATENALRAAAECKVQKLVYVSSLAAADRSQETITESGWNSDRSNVYFRSKVDAEQRALALAAEYHLDMVSVLPAAMIGEHCYRLTPTMELLQTILAGKLDTDPGFWFNFVDVKDVAEACWLAAQHGQAGERYLLANEQCNSVQSVVEIAQRLYPDRTIPTPKKVPRALVWLVAAMSEAVAAINKRPPMLQRNYLAAFTVKEYCNIDKARNQLGFDPRPPVQVLIAAFHSLLSKPVTL